MIIPYKYLVEHICDRIAKCKAYNEDKFSYTKTLDYFIANRHNLQANEKVLDFIEKILSDLTMKYEHTVLNKNYLKYTYDSIMFEQDSDNIQN